MKSIWKKNLLISRKAHLILPTHRLLDAASEAAKGKAKIGSTLKGIGPTYMDKTGRNGLRVGDIELSDFNERYRNLTDKHEEMLENYKVDIQYNLKELEAEFSRLWKYSKSFNLLIVRNTSTKPSKQVKNTCWRCSRLYARYHFGTYPVCNFL